MNDMKFGFWEWLTIQKQVQNGNKPPASPSPKRKGQVLGRLLTQKKKDTGEVDVMGEPGLKAFIRAQKKHQGEFVDQFAAFLIQIGSENEIDLMTNHLRVNSGNNFLYLSLMHDLYHVLF